MKMYFKFLMNYILNFIEFAFFIAAVSFLGIFFLVKGLSVLEVYLLPLLNMKMNIFTDVAWLCGHVIMLVFIMIVAFKKKYVSFSKVDYFQNVRSVIFLILSLIWFKKSLEIGVSLGLMLMTRQYY